MIDWKRVTGCSENMDFYDVLIKMLPTKAKMLEMGVFYGRGLIYLAEHSDFEIYGVDQFVKDQMPHQLEEVKDDRDFYEMCISNLFASGTQRRITLISLPSDRAVKMFANHSLDCVFLDGNHSYEAIAQDIALWRSKVKQGGILAGDDYIEPWGGVIKAVDEAFPLRAIHGQNWWQVL